jgi:hypothetical protein
LVDLNPTALPVDEALCRYKVADESFSDWLSHQRKDFLQATDADLDDYYEELPVSGDLEMLAERISTEVFQILFQNRNVLLLFNDMIANHIAETKLEHLSAENRKHFRSPGVLKRVRIPVWVKRAVQLRDRNLCIACQKDVSGSLSISSRNHFDHIVPLSKGGLNDVTNIQLLCPECNLSKGDEAITSDVYEQWYD